MVKISFIVPVYNVAEFLPDCIESLCGQKYPNLEIIMVNDGSTDESLRILQEYAKKDDRIKVLDQPNQGANAARNNGLKNAAGVWVCFVDGDDWIDLNMCSELLPYLNEDLDILFYSYQYVYPSGSQKLHKTETEFDIEKEDFKELQYATLNRQGRYRFGVRKIDTVSVWDKMYRLDFLRKNKLMFNEKLPKLQDLLFNLNVYEYANNGHVINKPYYNYRMNEKSVSKRYQEDIVKKFEVIHKYLNEFMERHWDDETMKKAYYERIATHLRTCIVLNYCNAQNTKSYGTRKEEFMKICQMPIFQEAMDQADLNNFMLKERILSKCIKKKWFWACELLYKMHRVSNILKSK